MFFPPLTIAGCNVDEETIARFFECLHDARQAKWPTRHHQHTTLCYLYITNRHNVGLDAWSFSLRIASYRRLSSCHLFSTLLPQLVAFPPTRSQMLSPGPPSTNLTLHLSQCLNHLLPNRMLLPELASSLSIVFMSAIRTASHSQLPTLEQRMPLCLTFAPSLARLNAQRSTPSALVYSYRPVPPESLYLVRGLFTIYSVAVSQLAAAALLCSALLCSTFIAFLSPILALLHSSY